MKNDSKKMTLKFGHTSTIHDELDIKQNRKTLDSVAPTAHAPQAKLHVLYTATIARVQILPGLNLEVFGMEMMEDYSLMFLLTLLQKSGEIFQLGILIVQR